jgi:hypothetical protein
MTIHIPEWVFNREFWLGVGFSTVLFLLVGYVLWRAANNDGPRF